MPDIKGNNKQIYDFLSSKGATGLGENADQFQKYMENDENRRQVYDYLSSIKASGIGNNYEEFSAFVYGGGDNAQQEETTQAGTPQSRERTGASPAVTTPMQTQVQSTPRSQQAAEGMDMFNAMRQRKGMKTVAERTINAPVSSISEHLKQEQNAAPEVNPFPYRGGLEKELEELREKRAEVAAERPGEDGLIAEYERRLKEFHNSLDPTSKKTKENEKWLREHKDAYQAAMSSGGKKEQDALTGQIQDILTVQAKRELKEAQEENRKNLPGGAAYEYGMSLSGLSLAGGIASLVSSVAGGDNAIRAKAGEIYRMAGQELNKGSKYDPGFRSDNSMERAWTAINQFAEGAANEVDSGSITMGLSEGSALWTARKVGDKYNEVVSNAVKDMKMSNGDMNALISFIDTNGRKLQSLVEELDKEGADLKTMNDTYEDMVRRGDPNAKKYGAELQKKLDAYNKRVKEEYNPLRAQYDNDIAAYQKINDAIDAAVNEKMTDGEMAMLDALEKYINAKTLRSNDVSTAASAGAGAEQSAEFMLDFILTGGVTRAGEKAATKIATRRLMKKLGAEAVKDMVVKPGLGLRFATGMATEAVRTGLQVTRNLQEYGNQLAEYVGKDSFGRYNFDRTHVNAAANTLLSRYIENWSEGFGGYFSAGEQALFRSVTGKSPVTAIGKTLRGYSGSIGNYLDYGKFDGMLNEMLEEVVGSGLNSMTGWLSNKIDPDGRGVGDEEALKQFFAGDNIATLTLSFLPMSVIGAATNVSAYLNMRERYNKGEQMLQGFVESGKLKRSELEYLTANLSEKTPEQIKDRIIEIADIVRERNGGALPSDFAKDLIGYVEGTFAKENRSDAWEESREKMAVVDAYSRTYSNPNLGFAWDVDQAEKDAKQAALVAGFTEEELDEKDSFILAREAASIRESEPVRSSALSNYAAAKAQAEGLRNGYERLVNEDVDQMEKDVRDNIDNDGVIVTATMNVNGEQTRVFVKLSQGATIGPGGRITTPSGADGLVGYSTSISPESEESQSDTVKASELSDVMTIPTDEYIALNADVIRGSAESDYEKAKGDISVNGMSRAISQRVGTDVVVSGNGAYMPVRVERMTNGGRKAVIKGDKDTIKAIAQAVGLNGAGSNRLEIEVEKLYPHLQTEADGSLTTYQEEETETAPAQERRQAPQVSPEELPGTQRNIFVNGVPTRVTVDNVGGDGVWFHYTDAEGNERNSDMPVNAFMESLVPEDEQPTLSRTEELLSQRKGADVSSIVGKEGAKMTNIIGYDNGNYQVYYDYLENGERHHGQATVSEQELEPLLAEPAAVEQQEESGEYGPVISTFDTNNGTVEVRTKTSEKDGVKTTKVVATRNGSEVATRGPQTTMPVPEGFALADVPEGAEVVGISELRESQDGTRSATALVRLEDGSYADMESRLVEKPEIPLDEKGEKIYDAPGVSVEDALEDLYKTDGLSEEDVDNFIAERAAAAEAARNPERGRMSPQAWGQAKKEAARVADFWSAMKQAAEQRKAAAEAPVADTTPAPEAKEDAMKTQRKVVNRAKKWQKMTGVKVNVLKTVEQVEKASKSAAKEIKKGERVFGWYSTRTGQVYVYLPNISDVAELDRTVIHEVVSHKGLRELLGQAGYDELCDRVWNELMTPAERKEWKKYNRHLTGTKEYLQRAAADEFIANLSENLDSEGNRSLFDKLVEWVKEILDRLMSSTDIEADAREKVASAETISKELLRELLSDSMARYVARTRGVTNADAKPLSMESLTPDVQEELREKGEVMDGGVVMDDLQDELKKETGYQTPNELDEAASPIVGDIRMSKTTMAPWAKTYMTYPGAQEHVVKVLENLTERMAANELVDGIVPRGTYKYGEKSSGSFAGPLRTNIEYVVTFDMDTSCPRSLQYLEYVKQVEARIGRPLTQRESIQLIEMMRVYGQMIPCVYCYCENKRQALKQYYTDFMTSRHAVISAKTDEEALEHMYGHATNKAAKESKDPEVVLNKAAYKVFKQWRQEKQYNPTLRQLWAQYHNDRNVVLTVLDSMLDNGGVSTTMSDEQISEALCSYLGITDKNAQGAVGDIVSEWKWNRIEDRPHDDYTPVLEEDELVVDNRTLALWREMTLYGKSASSAKNVLRYVPYTDELKTLSQEQRDYINGMGGLRMHSSNDFRIDYVLDYFQFMADMEVNHMMGHTYTKSPEFVRIFGNSGYKINMSIAAYEDSHGIRPNPDEGFDWTTAKELREKFPNAGTMLMATSDAQIQMALDSDWIDMFIPFHHSGLPKAVWYDMRHWSDYTAKQNEKFLNGDEMRAALSEDGVEVPKGAGAAEVEKLYNDHFHIRVETYKTGKDKGKRIRPHFLPGPTVVDGVEIPGHNNDYNRYIELCREWGVHPRFYGVKVKDNTPEGGGRVVDITEHPAYMKCIKETARTDTPQTAIKFNFDQPSDALDGMTPIDYAMRELEARAAAESQMAGSPVRNIYESYKQDPYGIVPQFIEGIIKHGAEVKERTGKDLPLDYLTPDSRKWFMTERKALEEAYKDVDTIPYHPHEYDEDGNLVMEPEVQEAGDEVAEDGTWERFRKVTSPAKIKSLEDGPKVKVYRSMQFIPDPNGDVEYDLGDGNGLQKGFLYAPMSAKVDGKWRDPIQLGRWEEAEENPDMADENGDFILDKGDGSGPMKVAYAPYLHTRRSPLNEQFSSAYKRGNLVIVESEIPESELSSNYTAEKSKKSTGEHDRPSGKVSNALAKKGMDTRKVILSRWAKPVRLVPNSEVADEITRLLGDSKLSFPYNVVTPGLRAELKKRGVRFEGWQGNKPNDVDELIAEMERADEENVRFAKNTNYVQNEEAKGEALLALDPIKVNANTITKEDGLSVAKSALKWYDENVGRAVEYDKEVGKIIIDRRSIKDSLNHKYGQRKLDAIASLIDGFGKSVYLTSLPDYDNNDIQNHYFAYPIEYDGERCYVICRTREDSNISRLYIHEVFPESAIKGETLQTAAGKDQYRRGVALYGSILQEVLGDKDSDNSETSKENNEVFRKTVTPEQDAEYMDAVNSGDMEKAEQMVRDAFKAAFPNNEIVDEDGEPLKVFHGTRFGGFTEFERPSEDDLVGVIWTTPDYKYAFGYSDFADEDPDNPYTPQVYGLYVNAENILELGDIQQELNSEEFADIAEALGYDPESLFERVVNMQVPFEDALRQRWPIWEVTKEGAFAEILRENGFDGVHALEKSGDELVDTYGVVEPSQVKTAEPVARDDNGDVIPLSERFNPENNDIRFSKRGTPEYEEESQKLFDRAKEHFGTTSDLREAGYALPDGTMLDFSGRHWSPGSDNSWMNGRRQVDHRDIHELNYEEDGNTPSGFKTGMQDFIQRGAVRLNSNVINLANKPTKAQEDIIRSVIYRANGNVDVDFGDGYDSDHYASYERVAPSRVINDIRGYYDDGVKPSGNTMFRKALSKEEQEKLERIAAAERIVTEKTLDSMPQAIGAGVMRVSQKQMPSGHKTDKGYYNPETNTVSVCIDNVLDERDAVATVLHETVGWKGLREIFGDQYREAMASSYAALDADGRAWVNGYMLRNGLRPGDEGILRGMQEYMAVQAERGEGSFLYAVNDILSKAVDLSVGTEGFRFTNRELAYVLRASYEHMKTPGWLNTTAGKAQDTLWKREYGINESDTNRQTDPEGPDAGTRFRRGDTGNAARDYEREMKDWRTAAVMEMQNADLPVKIGYEKTLKEKYGDKWNEKMKSLPENQDYLMRHNLSSSRADTENHNFKLFHFDPMLEKVKEVRDKLSGGREDAYERVLDYLYAVSGLERNEWERNNGGDAKDWSGLTSLMGRPKEEWQEAEEDARAMVDAFEKEVNDKKLLGELWDAIRSCTDFSLDHAYKYGLLAKDEYERLRGTEDKPRLWNYYLPLRGFVNRTAEEEYNYAGLVGSSRDSNEVVKEADGRWSKADNPLAYIANIAQKEIVHGNENWARQALYRFATNLGENSLLSVRKPWYVKDDATGKWSLAEPEENQDIEAFEANMKAKKEKGDARQGRKGLDLGLIMANKGHRNQHLIHVRIGGEDRMIWVNGNPALARAVSGAGREPNWTWFRAAGRVVSNTFTTYSLDFTAKNLLRDSIYSRMAMIAKEDLEYRLKFEKNWWLNGGFTAVPMIRLAAMWDSGELQRKPVSERTEKEQLFIDFMTDGGQTGYTIARNVEKIKKEMEKVMNPSLARRVIDGAKVNVAGVDVPILGIYTWGVRTLNEAFELLTRFTAYETSREVGRSGQRAAYDAKEISVNFNRRGAQSNEGFWGQLAAFFGGTHYFFNAGVQGFDNFLRLFKTNPKTMTAESVALMALGFLTPIINALISGGGDDDDRKDVDWYWNLPEWVRRNNIVLGWPEEEEVDENGNIKRKKGASYFCIPLPVEFRALYGLGDITNSVFYSHTYANPSPGPGDWGSIPTPGNVFLDILSTASGILPVNPIEGYNGKSVDFKDAVLRSLVPDLFIFGVDWMTNQDYTGRQLKKENMFTPHVPASQGAYASTPKALVEAAQWMGEHFGVDVAPGVVRDFLSNYGGGFYKFAEDLSKRMFTDDDHPKRWDDIPFLSGFTGHIDEDRTITYVNNILNEYKDVAENVVKKMNLYNNSKDIDAKQAFTEEDTLPDKAKIQKLMSGKDYKIAQKYYEGMEDEHTGKKEMVTKVHKTGKKAGQKYKRKQEIVIPGVKSKKKAWQDAREIWKKMEKGTPEEAKAYADVTNAWHEYYNAAADLAQLLMDYEYGEIEFE